MLHLTQGLTQDVYLTLTERQTLTAPNYLFVFTHATTKVATAFVLLNNQDISPWPERYNQFAINSSDLPKIGQYAYAVYEQVSASNTDPANAGRLLEQGLADMAPATPDTPAAYNTNNTFNVPA